MSFKFMTEKNMGTPLKIADISPTDITAFIKQNGFKSNNYYKRLSPKFAIYANAKGDIIKIEKLPDNIYIVEYVYKNGSKSKTPTTIRVGDEFVTPKNVIFDLFTESISNYQEATESFFWELLPKDGNKKNIAANNLEVVLRCERNYRKMNGEFNYETE